jgi:hypothetical protein
MNWGFFKLKLAAFWLLEARVFLLTGCPLLTEAVEELFLEGKAGKFLSTESCRASSTRKGLAATLKMPS